MRGPRGSAASEPECRGEKKTHRLGVTADADRHAHAIAFLYVAAGGGALAGRHLDKRAVGGSDCEYVAGGAGGARAAGDGEENRGDVLRGGATTDGGVFASLPGGGRSSRARVWSGCWGERVGAGTHDNSYGLGRARGSVERCFFEVGGDDPTGREFFALHVALVEIDVSGVRMRVAVEDGTLAEHARIALSLECGLHRGF